MWETWVPFLGWEDPPEEAWQPTPVFLPGESHGYPVHGILQARLLESVPFPSPRDLPNPGVEPRSPTLQVVSLPSEPPGKHKNTGVVSLSLLQGNFLTQEFIWGLLHCMWVLYQLNYPGSLFVFVSTYIKWENPLVLLLTSEVSGSCTGEFSSWLDQVTEGVRSRAWRAEAVG